jgi:hypothetical protein
LETVIVWLDTSTLATRALAKLVEAAATRIPVAANTINTNFVMT